MEHDSSIARGDVFEESTLGDSPSLLIIGYGNISRRDDGVAYHILQRASERFGLPECSMGPAEGEEPKAGLSVIFVHQMAPELAETLSRYDAVVFIDAHVEGTGWEPVHCQKIAPAFKSGMVTHFLRPDTLLALCASLYEHCPVGYMLSVLGKDFDFGEELSQETSVLADKAVDRLLDLVRSEGVEFHST